MNQDWDPLVCKLWHVDASNQGPRATCQCVSRKWRAPGRALASRGGIEQWPPDPVTISIGTLDQFNAAIAYVDAQTAGRYLIKLTADINQGTSALNGGNLMNAPIRPDMVRMVRPAP